MSNDCRHKLSLLAFEWLSESMDVWRAVKRRASCVLADGVLKQKPQTTVPWGPS